MDVSTASPYFARLAFGSPRKASKASKVSKASGSPRKARLGAPLGDAVPAHLGVERGAAESQEGGGGLLVHSRRLEGAEDRRPLDLLQRSRGGRGRRRRRLGPQRFRQVAQADLGAARDEDGALDGVLELAHVSRPGVAEQP